MKWQISLKNFIPQLLDAITNCYDAPGFLKKHKLWKGFARHKVVALILLILGALLSWQMLSAALLVINPQDPMISAMSFGSRLSEGFNSFFGENGQRLFSGSYKYLFLICMELFIFHLIIRANEIINGETEKLTSSMFIKAQIRMFKVMVLMLILKNVLSFGVSIPLNMVGIEYLEKPIHILIESFCLGFAIVDNYYELMHLNIKKSFNRSQQFLGIVIGIGFILYVLMFIPIIGPFAGTVIASIAVADSMNEWDPVDSLHPEKAYV